MWIFTAPVIELSAESLQFYGGWGKQRCGMILSNYSTIDLRHSLSVLISMKASTISSISGNIIRIYNFVKHTDVMSLVFAFNRICCSLKIARIALHNHDCCLLKIAVFIFDCCLIHKIAMCIDDCCLLKIAMCIFEDSHVYLWLLSSVDSTVFWLLLSTEDSNDCNLLKVQICTAVDCCLIHKMAMCIDDCYLMKIVMSIKSDIQFCTVT